METVLLVGVRLKTDPPDQTSLEELKRLTHTAGGGVARVFQVRVNAYQAATLIGRGKMEEIAQEARLLKADTVIFDDEISPAQQKRISLYHKARLLTCTTIEQPALCNLLCP